MAPRTDFPPVRACLFDMDGLIINTEDLYTECNNVVLARHGRPPLPWSVKARLQGRPNQQATDLFWEWAKLPISREQYMEEFSAEQRRLFPTAQPLPGVEKLLRDLSSTKANAANGQGKVHIALASSSSKINFALKSTHLPHVFGLFAPAQTVLGDDERIPLGKGKPLPHIYLLALQTINDNLPEGEPRISPEECLVFEDAVPGIEAGRRAGMRVVWCPHAGLKQEYNGREAEVLAALTGEAGQVDTHQLGKLDDGWGEYLPSLEHFPYARYGINVPSEKTAAA